MPNRHTLPDGAQRPSRGSGLRYWFAGGLLLLSVLLVMIQLLGPYYRVRQLRAAVARVNGSITVISSLPMWIEPNSRETSWPLFQTRVTSLSLESESVDDAWLARIRQFPTIESLSLRNTSVTDAGLEHVGTLENLTILDLSHTKVRGPGLMHLARFKGLYILNLRSCPVTDGDLAALDGVPLEWVDFGQTQIRGMGLRHLNSGVESLELDETPVSDEGLAEISRLAGLTRLLLSHTQVTDSGLKHLQPLRRLFELDLSGNSLTGSGFRDLPRRIPRLDIEGCPLSDRFLADLPEVWGLNLTRTGVTDAGVAALLKSGTTKRLRTLILTGTKVTDRGIELLSRDVDAAVALDELAVADTAITSFGVRSLQSLTKLKAVDGSATKASQHDWREFSRLRSVTLKSMPPENFIFNLNSR